MSEIGPMERWVFDWLTNPASKLTGRPANALTEYARQQDAEHAAALAEAERRGREEALREAVEAVDPLCPASTDR